MTEPTRKSGDVTATKLERARSSSHEARRGKPPPQVIEWDGPDGAIARFKKILAEVYKD